MKTLRTRFIVARHEWLHRLPFVPESWLNRACDRYDARLSRKASQ
jgi:hypothetical protein